MKKPEILVAVIFITVFLASGCGEGGGSGSDTQVALSGMVLNNHADANLNERGIGGARVVLIPANDVETADSVSPVEDLASGSHGYPTATTDSNGYYHFKLNDFSDSYPAEGNYFIFADPSGAAGEFISGGNASRKSLILTGASAVKQDIVLSDTSGSDATYIGSTVCLVCHPHQNSIKNTLHFVGIRKIGPEGTVTNGLMNMADTSVYDLSANNDEMLDKFTNPASHYKFGDDAAKTFWLGKDADGFYFQMTASTNPKFYIKFSYGGETGKWRGLFMTTVYAESGAYSPEHGETGSDYAYYVMSPIQYNEDKNTINGEKFVTYQADRWDFAGIANNGFTGDAELNSFDLACAACHGAIEIKTVENGPAMQRRIAIFPEDEDGYDIDGTLADINVSCEKCHGPGSNHINAGGRGKNIIAPDKLPSGRLTMICGTCHIRGENQTDIGGGAPLKADGNGNYETFRPGMSPAEFFGSSDGTGKNIAPFGTIQIESLTGNGYLETANFETDSDASWIDKLFDTEYNHSKSHQQHYQDLVRTTKFRNSGEILTCISCHDSHGSSYKHMVIYSADNNAICIPCHYGPGQVFPNISEGTVSRLMNDRITPVDFAAIGSDVEAHIADKTGSFQMAPYDPEGSAMGRCTLCHMPRTARSADRSEALVTQLGQYRHGDVTAHTFDVMATQAVNAMSATRGIRDTTPAGISDKCGNCHAFAGLN